MITNLLQLKGIFFLKLGLEVNLLSHSVDDFFCLVLDSAQQNLTCGDILYEAHSNARTPNPILWVADVIHNLSPRPRHKLS